MYLTFVIGDRFRLGGVIVSVLFARSCVRSTVGSNKNSIKKAEQRLIGSVSGQYVRVERHVYLDIVDLLNKHYTNSAICLL